MMAFLLRLEVRVLLSELVWALRDPKILARERPFTLQGRAALRGENFAVARSEPPRLCPSRDRGRAAVQALS